MSETTTYQDQIHTFYTNDMSHEYIGLKSGPDYYVTGHITADNVDLYKELVPTEEMDNIVEQLKDGNIKLDLDHSQFKDGDPTGEIPYGIIVDAKKVTDNGLTKIWVKAKLNQAHNRFKEVWKAIQDNFLDGFSIAYRAFQNPIMGEDGMMIKVLNKITILNIALTGVPVNSEADMTGSFMKALGKTPGLKNYEEKTMELKNITTNGSLTNRTITRTVSGKKSIADKDGAHVHTKEDPLGEHKHPEIEAYIKDELRWVNESISDIYDRIYKFENEMEKVNMTAVDEETKSAYAGGLKSLKETMKTIQGLKSFSSFDDKTTEVNKVPEEIKKDPVVKDPKTEDPKTEDPKTEVQDVKSLVEGFKSMQEAVEGFKSEIAAMKETKDKMEAFLAKPAFKSLVDKTKESKTDSQVASPLSMIR